MHLPRNKFCQGIEKRVAKTAVKKRTGARLRSEGYKL